MKTIIHIAFVLALWLNSPLSNAQNKEIDSLKRVLSVAKTDTTKVRLLNNIAFGFREKNGDSTLFYANKALLLAKKNHYIPGLGDAHVNLGNSAILLGDYKKAKKEFSQAVTTYNSYLQEVADDKGVKNGLGRAYASLGVVASEENNYPEALDYYQNALKQYQQTDKKDNIAKVYNNIGILYKSQKNNNKALFYFKKALTLQLETGEQAAAVSMMNIGVIYFEEKNYPKALEYYNKAEKLFKQTENLRSYALLKNYFGDYYWKQNNFENAETNYITSVSMFEQLQNKHGAALALYNLGGLKADKKVYPEALELVNKSLVYARETGLLDQTAQSERLLSQIYESIGNQKESLSHYKNYISARDSLNNLENNKKFLRAEMNFEYQMKESLMMEKNKRRQLITLFSIIGGLLVIGLIFVLFNRRQVKRRLTLQKELAEYEQKALHLQMNPHFVFNCLGSISSFIVQNGTDQALKYLSKFSKLMRLTLEYSKGSLIPIDKEIESLQNYLELEQLRFHNKFVFEIYSSPKVEFNMGIPPLLIQPFVENAILHGVVPKEGEGIIRVVFDVEDGKLLCTITDNGIGFRKSIEMKENSVKAHQSMALEITKKRLEIMEATLSKSAQIEINEDNGTKVTLKLPVQYIA